MTEPNPEAPKTDLSPIKDYKPVWVMGITYNGLVYTHPILVDFVGEVVGVKTASGLRLLDAINVFHKGSWICTAKLSFVQSAAESRKTVQPSESGSDMLMTVFPGNKEWS